MILFLLVFLGVYSAMHLLVWWGVSPLFPGRTSPPVIVLLYMGLMILAPLAGRLLERHDWALAARIVSWVGYVWLGFIFLVFCGVVVIALWDATVALLARSLPSAHLYPLHGPVSAVAVLLLAFGCSGYALYEARQLRVEEVRLSSVRLPAELNGLRIVQVSDIHLGLINGDAALEQVTRVVRELRPDMIVATGDIVDAQIDHIEGLSQRLRELPARFGKYAVLGNHEFYAGLPDSLAFIDQSGFQLLRNQKHEVYSGLTVVGVDDPTGRRPSLEGALLSEQEPGFVLLLKHRPEVDPVSRGAFDLQLSGHTHRGQIAPFHLLTGLRYPMQDGLYSLGERSHLYTSRGTGTWGPPMRLFSPPEVTLFVVENRP